MIAFLVFFASALNLFSEQLDVLVIGSSKSFSDTYYSTIPRNQKSFNPQLVVNQLQSILDGDATITSANVVFEDIYESDSTVLGGTTVQAKNYSLLGYHSQPDERAARWSNLKGEAGTAWDYVVILGDPSMIANVPGVYARGVKYIVDQVREGTAEPILMMQWPHAGSSVPIEDFGEVTYRVGDTGGITVSPAGFAWADYTSKDTGSHPTPDGSYLAAASLYSTIFNRNATTSNYTYNDTVANLAHATVQARANQAPYPGLYSKATPHQILWKKDRAINGVRTGSSSEAGFMDSFNYSGGRYYDALIESELLIKHDSGPKFHLGRAPNSGGGLYSQDPASNGYFASIGFSFQVLNTGGNTMSATGTGHIDMLDGMDYISYWPYGDQRLSFGMIQRGEVSKNVRTMPIFSLWGAASTELGLTDPYQDGRHYATDVNEIGVSYFMTLVTGRCPIGKNGTERERERQRIGYEAAWTMGTLSLRPPGFSTFPSSVDPKILNVGEEEVMELYFVTKPQAPVTVEVSVNPPGAAIVSPSVLTFDGSNHDEIRNVRVITLPNSSKEEGFQVVFSTSSDDMCFDGLNDSWDYSLRRSAKDIGESYEVIELPVRKLSAFGGESLDVDLNLAFGDELNTSLIAPFHGALTWSNGNIRYQPEGGFVGGDGFSYYTVHDGKLYKGHIQIEVLTPGSVARVSVEANDALASESGDTGEWTITREGDSSADLLVEFSLSGSATLSTDFTVSVSSPVTIPAGSNSVSLSLSPLADGLKEGGEFAVLAIAEGDGYVVGVDLDSIAIEDIDNATPAVSAGADQAIEITGQALWTPSFNPDGLVAAWYDPSDLESLTVAGDGEVTKCNDKSGYGNHLDKNSKGPISGVRALNGKNVFDCTGDRSFRKTSIYRHQNGGDLAVYLVADLDDTSGSILKFEYQFNNRPGFEWLGTGEVKRLSGDFTGFNLNHGIGPIMGGAVWDVDEQTVSGYVNGAGVSSTTGYTKGIGANILNYGKNTNAGLAELIFTEDTSDVTREKMEGYLAWKWGREAELTTEHPYRYGAPSVPVATFNLTGSSSDADDASLITTWSLMDGPVAVDFEDASAPDTTATFYAVGTYVLRFTVTDGSDTVHDDVVITVNESSLPLVSVVVLDADASETGPDEGSFLVSRTGDTTDPLTVSFALNGTATAGSDYTVVSTTSATIPAGETSVIVVVTPLDDTVFAERDEIAILVIVPDSNYFVTLASNATVTIEDNDNNAPVVDAGLDQTVALTNGGTPSPVSGAAIFLDAGLDDGTNGTWEDSLSKWDLAINTGVTFLADAGSSYPGISSAYDFPGGTSGGGGCDGTSLHDMGGSIDGSPITLEIWFKPDESSSYPTNGQVLWETGGGTGLGIFYNNGSVEVAHDSDDGQLSADVSDLVGEFIQVVVTFDTGSSTNNFKLYINGELKATGSRSDTDMCGGDGSGLGNRGESNVGGAGGGDSNTESFEGMIAVFRSYHTQVLTSEEIATNFQSIAGGVSATAILSGSVSDADGDALTSSWSVISRPIGSQVVFSDASMVDSTVVMGSEGTYVLRLTSTDGIDEAGDDVIIVVNPLPSVIYTTWLDGPFSGPFNETDLTDNGDGDSNNNLMEFAFGTDPTIADGDSLLMDGSVNGQPVAEKGAGDVMEFYFVRRDDHGTSGSLSYTVEFSSDLGTFYTNSVTPSFVADSTDDSAYEVAKVPYPATLPNGETAKFGRIQVELVP